MLKKLQIVQNNCARFIFKISLSDHIHITSYLHRLKWLPIISHIEAKVINIAFISISTELPFYLFNLFSLKHNLSYNLRNFHTNNYNVPFINTKFARRAFSFYAPKLLNSLPLHLKNINDVKKFKKELKKYYFSISYIDENTINPIYKCKFSYIFSPYFQFHD